MIRGGTSVEFVRSWLYVLRGEGGVLVVFEVGVCIGRRSKREGERKERDGIED